MKKTIMLCLSVLILAVACSNTGTENTNKSDDQSGKKDKNANSSVVGTLVGAFSQPVYLQYLTANTIENIDTAITNDKGEFEFKFNVSVPGYYRIGLDDNNICVLIIEPKDKIKLHANASNIYMTYEVENSNESQRLKELNEILAKRDSINMAFQSAQMTQNKEQFESVLAVYDRIMADVSIRVKAFIDENPGTLSSLAAIQNLSIDDDYAYFDKVITALESKAAGNEFYEAIKIQVEMQRKLAIGSPAPEISLPQPNGVVLNLSDLRGKYVLIDFWASWCGPCRKENPNVVKVYNKYHDKGFEILGVSLDKDSKNWLNAIEQDQLKWKHISDLKYWNSAVVSEYQIKGIPLTYLIDPEGNIIAKNLRGPSLEQKLAEIFK